jgi:hypothetical protein
MCTSHYITYTCGSKKEMEFIQCAERRGTNVKCDPIVQVLGKEAQSYCASHLVEAKEGDAAQKDDAARTMQWRCAS